MENANQSSDVFLGLHDFLERMRQPTAADFVKSIKSFIVSFSNNAPDPEKGSAAVQQFLSRMEAAFRAHPLWAGCSEEELDSAGEGLEKYVMTKLFTRVFASLPDDVKLDGELSEKMALLQQFIRPENLDITPSFQNETSWLLAQKELQKINMYKAPRDKLVCILNCCKVINNLLLNASMASNENPPGADEFLPVLIYVIIKANPPQFHSNLLYIQRYRHQSRLVGEASYYFTNMLSAESFISNIDAKALSMDETEFESNMESARAVLSGISNDLDDRNDSNSGQTSSAESMEPKHQASDNKGKIAPTQPKHPETNSGKDESSMTKTPVSDLENRGASLLLKEDPVSQVFQQYPYLYTQVGDLTINDVEDMLNNYKQLVFKYACLVKGLTASTDPNLLLFKSQLETKMFDEQVKDREDNRAVEQQTRKSGDDTGDTGDCADSGSPYEEQSFESKLPKGEEASTKEQAEAKDESYQSELSRQLL